MYGVDIVNEMQEYATECHRGGKRKYSDLPYITHPALVVEMLKRWGYTENEDPYVLCLGWGHDIYEETDITEEDLYEELSTKVCYGAQIASGIMALSFAPESELTDKEYDQLKAVYLTNIALVAPREVLVVKMADRLCNVLEFIQCGQKDYAKKYFKKGEVLFERLAGMPRKELIEATLKQVNEKLNG